VKVLAVGSGRSSEQLIARQLQPFGVRVERRARLAAGEPADSCDVIVFDVPSAQRGQVIDYCRQTSDTAQSAVRMVLQRGADPDFRIRVLEAGADDCLAAPHNPREVMARIKALLRRRARSLRYAGRHYIFDGYLLDSVSHVIRSPDGRAVEITPTQSRLLTALLARPGEVISREQLIGLVLGEASDCFDRTIDVHVSRLRKRLARVTGPGLIAAYRGVGYRLDVAEVTQ
jgi:two-component system, OmpR family, response regulator